MTTNAEQTHITAAQVRKLLDALLDTMANHGMRLPDVARTQLR